MKKISGIAFISIAFISASSAQQVLTLDKAIKQGLEHSKTLKASNARVEASTAHHASLNDNLIPSIKLTGSYTRLSNIDPPTIQFPGFPKPVALFPVYVDNYYSQASAKEILFAGLRGQYALQSASYLEQASRLDYEKDQQDVIYNIANAYYNIYKIKATKKLLEENLRQQGEHLKEVKNYEENGVATHNDVLKVQLQQSNLQLSLIDIDNTLKTALYNFDLMLGIDPKTPTDIDTLLTTQNRSVQAYDELQQKTLTRSDIKAAEQRLKASEKGVKIAKGNYYPLLSAAANYYYANPNARFIPPQQKFLATWDVGATLTYDLSALYTNKHQIQEAAAQHLQNQANFEQLTDAAKMELNQTYLAYTQAYQKISVAKESVQQAEENYKIVSSKYSNQVALLTDLLDADLLLLQARINLSNANTDAELAYYKIQKATGDLKY